ncbi:unnamed protein product [Cylicocyclus nassatus]|uniref:STAS domain-containing protein n=1 Tax=Cylicocyclus nassatus TaxID=53992 RepID=A0AA36MFK3_CYLNA|nr:unnamed protein product [Cylicocyclus nassatus]
MKPLLKTAKESSASAGRAGEEKHVKIVADQKAEKKTALAEQKVEKSTPALRVQKTPGFTAPSQSTQSQSPESRDLYAPEQIKVLHINDIMEASVSPSSRAVLAADEGKRGPIKVEKPILDQEKFDKYYGYRRIDLTWAKKLHWHFKQVSKWKRADWAHFWMGRVPISKWLSQYKWREDLRSDLLGGTMLSIICLPQSLAYGYLVGVPPIYGLITAIFIPLVYVIFGSSRHNSPGCFAIAALMVGGVVEKFAPGHEVDAPLSLNHTASPPICCKSASPSVSPSDAVVISSSLTFVVGLWQIFFGLLNAGLLAVWLSDHLVQGLTSGAAVHVVTSQLKSITGADGLPPTSEPFGLIKFYLCFYKQAHTVNLHCVVLSLIAVSLLLLSSFFIDPILKKWIKIKFPMEFVVVLFSILLIYLSEGTRYHINVPILGQVDSGLPGPRLPSFEEVGELIGQGFTVAIISFVIHIALAKLVSKKFNYEIDVNQEWFALGAAHTLSSFFGCFVGGSSIGRTMTQVKLGTKSQLSTLICTLIMIGFVYGAGKFIYHLPKAILGCIIVVAMKDLLIQLVRGFHLCKESTVDFMIFFVTLVSVILTNVNIGLIVGIVFALLTVVFRTQWADSFCMGRIPGTSDFKGLGHYRSAEELPGIKVFRFDAPLYFANAELFISRVNDACGLNPVLVKAKLNESAAAEKNKTNMDESAEDSKNAPGDMELRVVGRRLADASTEVVEDSTEHVVTQLTHIIIDCSSIPYIDLMGKDAICQIVADYAAIDITVLIANAKVTLRQLFETSDFYQKVSKNKMFVSVNDAVSQALKEQRERFPDRPPAIMPSEIMRKPVVLKEEPVALSPAQKTIVSNVYEEGEEQITQSAASTTQAPEFSGPSTRARKGIIKRKDDLAKKDEKKRKDEIKKDDQEKKKDEGKVPIWRRPFKKVSRKDLDQTQ